MNKNWSHVEGAKGKMSLGAVHLALLTKNVFVPKYLFPVISYIKSHGSSTRELCVGVFCRLLYDCKY